MVKFDIPDIQKDLAMSMTMAAFSGVAWYTCVELNVRLFYLFNRRKGLYFWSCALCSWGIFLHPLAIILADFQVIKNTKVSIPLIYLSWWLMTIPQSMVMYSRLHLVMQISKYLRWVLYMILFTTVVISIPSMVIGPMSQQPDSTGMALAPIYSIWVKIENATWFIQETVISVLYIIYTQKHLRDTSILSRSSSASKQVMHHLIATNLLIIVLDIALLAILYAGMFYLGGAFKPAVYGVKLRIEFSVLDRLVAMTKARGLPFHQYGSNSAEMGTRSWVSKSFTRGDQQRDRIGRMSNHSERSDAPVLGGIEAEQGIKQTTEIALEPCHTSNSSSRAS